MQAAPIIAWCSSGTLAAQAYCETAYCEHPRVCPTTMWPSTCGPRPGLHLPFKVPAAKNTRWLTLIAIFGSPVLHS